MRADYFEAARGASAGPTAALASGEIASAFESALYAMGCARHVVEAFLDYNARFRSITRRAPARFAARDWGASQRDAVERIELYEQRIAATIASLETMLGENLHHRALWAQVRRHFANLIEGLPDAEFCKTFFSSVTRKIFATVGVSPDIEFVATGLDPLASARPRAATRRYRGGTPRDLVAEMLASQPLPWAERDTTAAAVCVAIGRRLVELGSDDRIEALELIDAVFYQSTRAYLVGRAFGSGAASVPFALALRSSDSGVELDAPILDEDGLSILFGFARSYFHVDLERVADSVAFLKELLPRKPTGELFTVLGRAKQGKTERYRNLIRHLDASGDLFELAPGQRGLVMICFALPSFDVVFKVIRDRIPDIKTATRRDVVAKYNFVFRHDRAGRLIDAQEFRRLRFPLARFSLSLRAELLAEAGASAHVDGNDLVFEHLYIERRVTPLDLYLRDASPAACERAAIDYGQAIRDLAFTDVFPGDLLQKNFGVTRHGRVVFYDYDELCRVSECEFRELPTARFEEDEMRDEPWFHVGERDVFPETFVNFLGLTGAPRERFLAAHADLFGTGFWRATQRRLAAGETLEVLPYTA